LNLSTLATANHHLTPSGSPLLIFRTSTHDVPEQTGSIVLGHQHNPFLTIATSNPTKQYDCPEANDWVNDGLKPYLL
jgi:hypothetical protein